MFDKIFFGDKTQELSDPKWHIYQFLNIFSLWYAGNGKEQLQVIN